MYKPLSDEEDSSDGPSPMPIFAKEVSGIYMLMPGTKKKYVDQETFEELDPFRRRRPLKRTQFLEKDLDDYSRPDLFKAPPINVHMKLKHYLSNDSVSQGKEDSSQQVMTGNQQEGDRAGLGYPSSVPRRDTNKDMSYCDNASDEKNNSLLTFGSNSENCNMQASCPEGLHKHNGNFETDNRAATYGSSL